MGEEEEGEEESEEGEEKNATHWPVATWRY